jgi:SAM-dependent methyltransferase
MTDHLVKEYYTSQVRAEWRRLVKSPYSRLELETTLHFMEKYLPPSGLVLDAGGGPGRYTYELARRGYDMLLLDATQANLDFAQRMVRRKGIRSRIKGIECGSIVDLSRFADGTFDAVICTGGPLSHVLDRTDRLKAISELVRVLKPGGPFLASAIGRIAVLMFILDASQAEIGDPHFQLLLDTGDYYGGRGFTACHFYLPEEITQEFKRDDLEILALVGLQGISSVHARSFNRLAKDERRFSSWLQAHYQTCTHPTAIGMSEHILVVCKKKL